jgi:hypothetical protein
MAHSYLNKSLSSAIWGSLMDHRTGALQGVARIYLSLRAHSLKIVLGCNISEKPLEADVSVVGT